MRANEANNRPWGWSEYQLNALSMRFFPPDVNKTLRSRCYSVDDICRHKQCLLPSPVSRSIFCAPRVLQSTNRGPFLGSPLVAPRSLLGLDGFPWVGVAPVGLCLCHHVRSMRSCIVVCSSIVDRGLYSWPLAMAWASVPRSGFAFTHRLPHTSLRCRLAFVNCQHLCNAFFTERSIVVLVWLYMCFGIVFSFCHALVPADCSWSRQELSALSRRLPSSTTQTISSSTCHSTSSPPFQLLAVLFFVASGSLATLSSVVYAFCQYALIEEAWEHSNHHRHRRNLSLHTVSTRHTLTRKHRSLLPLQMSDAALHHVYWAWDDAWHS